ncbi:MAG: M48 family metallopeptidase [Rickettsiales bacterium]|nr:M48 family metallopeptidase [Rickettsiales bacterium]
MAKLKSIFSAFVLVNFLASCQAMQAVDRKLYDVTNKVTTKDLVTGKRSISSADRPSQIAKGNQASEKIINGYLQKGAKINEKLSKTQYERALNIFNRVHSVSHLRNEDWKLILLPDNEFNAFVTGGTYLFVNKGLMDKLSFDDEVAAVLAHEIAHVSSNHVFEREGGMMASMLAGSKSAKSNAYQAGYSTNDEYEADNVGILYMALAGYDPYAAGRIWQKIYSSSGTYGQAFQTHPITSERMNNANQVANKVKQYQISGEINPNFQNILSGNNLYQTTNEQALPQAGMGGGLAAALMTAADFYSKKTRAKSQAVNQSNRIATLQEIQQNMQIIGAKKLDENSFAMRIQYSGARPVSNLAVMAVSPEKQSLYRLQENVMPNSAFTAIFDNSVLQMQDGSKAKMKLVVDEGRYLD